MNEIGYYEGNCFEKEWLTFDWGYKYFRSMRTCSIIEVINKYEYRNIAPYQKLQAGNTLHSKWTITKYISLEKKRKLTWF